jgi:PAS domain S-box-containing protein
MRPRHHFIKFPFINTLKYTMESNCNLTEPGSGGEAEGKDEEKYLKLVNLSPDPVAIVRDGYHQLVNAAFTKLFGYNQHDIDNELAVSELLTEQEKARSGRRMGYSLAEKEISTKNNRINLVSKDGRLIPCEAFAGLINYKGMPSVLVVLRDITELRDAENALQKNTERLNLALEATEEGIWDWVIPKEEIFFSDRLKKLLGLDKDAGSTIPIDEWKNRIHPDHRERVSDMFREHLKKKLPFNVDYLYRSNSGEYRWLNSRSMVKHDDKGTPQRMIGATRDINTQKKAEELIRNLCHQFINSRETERRIISCELHDRVARHLEDSRVECAIIAEHSLLTTEVRQRILAVSESLRTALTAVHDLSNELRLPGLEEVGLVRTLYEYCRNFSENNNVNVEFRFSEMEDLKLSLDTNINLYRLVQEGLNNIRKHANASRATIKLAYSFPNIMLRIEDNGSGFNVKKRLSEAANEMRMGLSTMKERVMLLQGKMDIQSTPGKGTKIIIEIPFSKV